MNVHAGYVRSGQGPGKYSAYRRPDVMMSIRSGIVDQHGKDLIMVTPQSALPVGTVAPEFTLHSTPDQAVSLSEFRGQPVVLVFYPADWSPVCGDQLALYNEVLPEFQRLGAEIIGISVDGIWCHLAFGHD